ncbi:hypothetical protein DFJ58DRAFT_847961 [Suillus subalutaceus]|uniref:uncharacterized protein n=1 Tax=Suillus subalutaceus TaxID=48586 RepID=UPI001B873DD6|nr:uncharacterized protein DFJ58DRAFT_847961 [Suillus subalutaceus]KAG1832627.1 hypothetical protein DFJ58DRAFT_847961 [Suillus subalutaceus]
MARIFDLCTILDRLMGGSTIVVHHPGTIPPNMPIVPESLKADIYINPKVLLEHRKLHPVVAKITQLFLAKYATPLARSFTLSCTKKGWRAAGSLQTPAKGKGRAETSLLPFIPPPITPSSLHFVLPGHPDGSLEVLLLTDSNILSYVPHYDTQIMWVASQVGVQSSGNCGHDSTVNINVPISDNAALITPMKKPKVHSLRGMIKDTHITVVDSSSDSDTCPSSPWSYPKVTFSNQKDKNFRAVPLAALPTSVFSSIGQLFGHHPFW